MTLRFSQYLLSAVAAAFFVLCSLTSTAYAVLDEYDFTDGEIKISLETTEVNSGVSFTTGALNAQVTSHNVSKNLSSSDSSYSFFNVFSFYNESESLIAKDYTFNATFKGLVVAAKNSNGMMYVPATPDALNSPLITVVLYNSEGEPWISKDATVTFFNHDMFYLGMDVSIPSVEQDVYRIDIQFSAASSSWSSGLTSTIDYRLGFNSFFVNWSFQEPQAGETRKIVELLIDLPGNLWDKFESGLISLFVPGEGDLYSYKAKWESLLRQHLGVIYEAGDIIGRYVEAFEYSEKSTIHVPPVTLLFGQTEWTFGNWEVEIVPAGFDVLYDILKIITAFLATSLFVNAMKSRFERLVGGDTNA